MMNLGSEGKSGFWRRIKPWHFGLSVGSVTAVVLIGGWFGCDRISTDFGLAMATALAVGLVFFILRKAKFPAWSAAFLIGWLIGLGSAIEFFMGEDFERRCFVALATAIFWLVLLFFVGALAEFIRQLHRLTHRLSQDRSENREKRP